MKYILAFLTALILFTGCAGTTYTKSITHGNIENSNIVIRAIDDSFKLKGEFKTPFTSEVHYHSMNINGNKMIHGYVKALQYDAKHVRVKVPYLENELYGVLVFDNADTRGSGVGTESYKIIIPKPYVDAAKNGKISVVYEYYHIKDDSFVDLSEVKKYPWILWISDKDIFR